MNTPVRLRERAAIATELQALGSATSLPASFRAGARAALDWVGGRTLGPLTGTICAAPPSLRAIVAELSTAEAVIYGPPSQQHDFAVGVEHALLWAEFATPTPPSTRTFTSCTCETVPEAGAHPRVPPGTAP